MTDDDAAAVGAPKIETREAEPGTRPAVKEDPSDPAEAPPAAGDERSVPGTERVEQA